MSRLYSRRAIRYLLVAAAVAAGLAVAADADADGPRFVRGACPADVTRTFPADLRVDCGTLIVPESRSKPSSRTIRLEVAIMRSSAAKPAPDPLLFVQGGPAAAGIVPQLAAPYFRPFLRSRDVILFDQRGTGHSKPALTCPELDRVDAAAYPSAPTRAQYLVGVRACKQRLVKQGVDLAAYTDAESAADVRDLRTALGLKQWNLLALSAGGELALTTMRLYPEGIRSVVFDSAWGNQTLWGPNFWRNADRYLGVLFARCAAEPACKTSYPTCAHSSSPSRNGSIGSRSRSQCRSRRRRSPSSCARPRRSRPPGPTSASARRSTSPGTAPRSCR